MAKTKQEILDDIVGVIWMYTDKDVSKEQKDRALKKSKKDLKEAYNMLATFYNSIGMNTAVMLVYKKLFINQ